MARSPLRQVYAALADKPLGRHLSSAAVGLTAPYFRTIRATVVSLEDLTGLGDDEAREVLVPVDITDPAGQIVVQADTAAYARTTAITMWITPATRTRTPQGG